MMDQLTLGNLTFEVRRSARRRKVGLTVDRGGELLIHAPETATDDELTRWTRAKLLWVHRKLALREEMRPEVHEPEYVTGERFGYLGRSYRLTISRLTDEPFHFNGTGFILREDARPAGTEHFRRWYIARGAEWLMKRSLMLASKIGITPTKIEVRDLGYRWGSCGKNQVLYFNWKALQLPVRLIDYLLLHEMAHLREPNHSAAFWHGLDRALPDWSKRRDELRVKAREIFWCNVMAGE